MKIESSERDHFPKSLPTGGYLGDGLPLCVGLPPRAFLSKGASYRFLGTSPRPDKLATSAWGGWVRSTFALDATSSPLFTQLCHRQSAGAPCRFKSVLALPETLACHGLECHVETAFVLELTNAATRADGSQYTVYY